ncbi:MAG: general secretion pathway protein GspB [Gammaproteobacteria bacterium]|nr:general secretion pathway protein GspB [Gammaproteobacteria bacterium]
MSEIAGSGIVMLLLAVSVNADVLHDPMRPYQQAAPIEHESSGTGFTLSAILYSTDRRVAVVNGRPVTENERINGASVRTIQPGQVVLDVDGEILKLKLHSGQRTK